MPEVWYPFTDDHKHAGKYYKGWMPEGNVRMGLKQSGARLVVPSADPELDDYGPPKTALTVTEEQLIREELGELRELWDLVNADISAAGRTALATQHDRRFSGLLVAMERELGNGNMPSARLQLTKLEELVETAQRTLLGGGGTVLPARAVQYTATPEAEPEAPAAQEGE